MSSGQIPIHEKDDASFIVLKTVPAAVARMMRGEYKGLITTLKATKGNTGDVRIGKDPLNCIFVLDGNESQVTRIDLDKLYWYSDNGTETVQIWAEKDFQKVKVGFL